MTTQPLPNACEFCGATVGLSWELDYRGGVTHEEAVKAGYFWCCGWCFAHVLNGAYSNNRPPPAQNEPAMVPCPYCGQVHYVGTVEHCPKRPR